MLNNQVTLTHPTITFAAFVSRASLDIEFEDSAEIEETPEQETAMNLIERLDPQPVTADEWLAEAFKVDDPDVWAAIGRAYAALARAKADEAARVEAARCRQ